MRWIVPRDREWRKERTDPGRTKREQRRALLCSAVVSGGPARSIGYPLTSLPASDHSRSFLFSSNRTIQKDE